MTAAAGAEPDPFNRLCERPMPCFARQPILDERGRVFGYELFYGPQALDCEEAGDGTLASARILTEAVSALGLEALTGRRPVFVKLSRDLLLRGCGTLLPPSAMVIELDRDMPIDANVLETCRRLSDSGYAIGLDSAVVGDSPTASVMPYAKFVRVNVAQTTAASRRALVTQLRFRGVRLIAEMVETQEIAAEVRSDGYRLLQGRYYCMPKPFDSARIAGNNAAYLQLLGGLNRSDLSVDEVEDLIKHDASLCYRVLRSINSPIYGLRREISSIRQAIVLLGQDQIRKWASVWVLSGLNINGIDETLSVALVRARACELLGRELADADDRSGCFLLGLCSVLDVLIGQPMVQILSELPLSGAIKDALLGKRSRLRPILDAVVAYERGAWDEAALAVTQARVAAAPLPNVYASALAWVPALRAAVEGP